MKATWDARLGKSITLQGSARWTPAGVVTVGMAACGVVLAFAALVRAARRPGGPILFVLPERSARFGNKSVQLKQSAAAAMYLGFSDRKVANAFLAVSSIVKEALMSEVQEHALHGLFDADEIAEMAIVLDELCAEASARGLLQRMDASTRRTSLAFLLIGLNNNSRLPAMDLKAAALKLLESR